MDVQSGLGGDIAPGTYHFATAFPRRVLEVSWLALLMWAAACGCGVACQLATAWFCCMQDESCHWLRRQSRSALAVTPSKLVPAVPINQTSLWLHILCSAGRRQRTDA